MKDFTTSTKTGKVWSRNNAIYVKSNWRWRAKKVMFKMDGVAGRWTQVIKPKHLIDDLIPFYLVPLLKLHEAGEGIVINITTGKEEWIVISIDDILNSNKLIGQGALTQVLFDRTYKHLSLKKENKQ